MMTFASGGTMFGSSCTRMEYAARPPPMAASATRTAASVGRVKKSRVINGSQFDLEVQVDVCRRGLCQLLDAVRKLDDALNRVAGIENVAGRRDVTRQDV